MTAVAVIPASPPLTKGNAALITGLCRKLVVDCFGFSTTACMAFGASDILSLADDMASLAVSFAEFIVEDILREIGGSRLSKTEGFAGCLRTSGYSTTVSFVHRQCETREV